MKRGMLLLSISLLFALSSGCATKEYVKQQIDEAMKTSNDRCAKAEAAAEMAQSAANQCKKAFELRQMK